jgi:hypothetical protein
MDHYQRQQSQGSISSQINNAETTTMQMNRTGGGIPMLGSTINMQSTTQITDISKRQKRPKKKVKKEP